MANFTDTVLAVNANAVVFGPCDVARSKISTPELSFESDLHHQASTRLFLPQFLISVYFMHVGSG